MIPLTIGDVCLAPVRLNDNQKDTLHTETAKEGTCESQVCEEETLILPSNFL